MDVDPSPSIVRDVALQLQQRNSFSSAFCDIVAEYQKRLRQCREYKVRNAQLEKEARELRDENAHLQGTVEEQAHAAVSNEKVRLAENRAKELQDELTDTYKEKSRLAEQLVAASQQLQIVRESNEAQARELADLTAKGRELRGRIKELSEALEKEQAANALVTSEIQARLDEKEAAVTKAEKFEQEAAELSKRLVELKMTEIERMNEVNRMCDEMLTNARNAERAAAAAAASPSGRQGTGRFNSMPAGSLHNILNGVMDKTKGRIPQGSIIESIVPDELMRSTPAHEGGCYTLAFDRSGVRMASGGADKTIRLWDPCSGMQTGTLHGMLETTTEVSFTCDQKHLLASGADQALRMWDLSSGRVRHTLTGHSQKVCSVDCSPLEPNRAVSGATDRCIKVWDLARGYCLNTHICHSSINSVRTTMDATMIVSGHFDGTLRFWDLRSGKLSNEVTGLHTQQITSVAVGNRSGAVLSLGKDNMVKVTDSRTFQVQRQLRAPGFNVAGVWCKAAWGADERHVTAGSSDGTVFVWSTERAGAVVKTLKEAGSQSIVATAWSPQGTPLVTGDKAGLITFWQPREDVVIGQDAHHGGHGVFRHTF